MVQTRQRLAFTQAAGYLAATQIFGIVHFYGRAGRGIAGEQRRYARFVRRAPFPFRLVIQDHNAHPISSVTLKAVPIVPKVRVAPMISPVQIVQKVQAVQTVQCPLTERKFLA